MSEPQIRSTLSARPDGATQVRVAAITDEGGRRRNEDALVAVDLTRRRSCLAEGFESATVGPRGVLLAVADGMGGHADGDIASSLAISSLVDGIAAMEGGPFGPACLHDAVQLAHERVWEVGRHASGSRRMGTTLTAVHLRGRVAYVAQVGDSRAYVLRSGVLHPLTRDQTYTQMLIDDGVLHPDEAHLSPFPHVILQAIGNAPDLHLGLRALELRQRDRLLVCSDGLTGALSDERIAHIMSHAPSIESAAGELLAHAINPPGDNVTIVLADVSGALPPPDPAESFDKTVHVFQEFAFHLESTTS